MKLKNTTLESQHTHNQMAVEIVGVEGKEYASLKIKVDSSLMVDEKDECSSSTRTK